MHGSCIAGEGVRTERSFPPLGRRQAVRSAPYGAHDTQHNRCAQQQRHRGRDRGRTPRTGKADAAT